MQMEQIFVLEIVTDKLLYSNSKAAPVAVVQVFAQWHSTQTIEACQKIDNQAI